MHFAKPRPSFAAVVALSACFAATSAFAAMFTQEDFETSRASFVAADSEEDDSSLAVYDNDAPAGSAYYPFSEYGDQYFAVDTGDTVLWNNFGTRSATTYFDSMVKLTPTTGDVEVDEGAKFLIFVDGATSNLCVISGTSENDRTPVTNVLTTAGQIDPADWHRLTVKAIAASVFSFQVFLDGSLLETAGGTDTFYSLTDDTTIATVGISGTGSLDNFAVRSTDPLLAPADAKAAIGNEFYASVEEALEDSNGATVELAAAHASAAAVAKSGTYVVDNGGYAFGGIAGPAGSVVSSSASGTVVTYTVKAPVVIWDGGVAGLKFDNLTRTVGDTTYTLNLNPVGSANTVALDSSYIQIANNDAQCGVTITTQNSDPAVTNGFGTSGTITVLMKCRDMPVSEASNRAIISLMDGNKYKYGGTTQQDNGAVLGVYIASGTSGWMWLGSTAGMASLSGAYLDTMFGEFSAAEQVVALTYSNAGGTCCYVNGAPIQSNSGLKSSSKLSSPYGVALGGVDVSTGSQFYALKNMKIEGVAVFASTLDSAEVAGYAFPSDGRKVLTLDGTAAIWSAAAWKDEAGETSAAPISGSALLVVNSSTTLTVDEAVSLDKLEVRGAEDAVLTLVAGSGSIATKIAIVNGGVLKQGSESVLGATPKIYVAEGGTFDMNGFGINAATEVRLAGSGAGNWPWALTSSGGAGGAILGGLKLAANATIGGENELKVGTTGAGYNCYLNRFTLTKTGTGPFTATNMKTPGNGTIDVQGGDMTVNQWNNFNTVYNNGVYSFDGATKVILRSGASLANNTNRRILMDTLELRGGTLSTDSQPFGVKSLVGSGATARLVFAGGASASLTGDLSVSSDLTLEGDVSFSRDSAAVGGVTVAVPGTLSASGTVTVGSGVTFNLGANRPDATFAGEGLLALARASSSENSITLKAANEMSEFGVVLYDTDGTTLLGKNVSYDAEGGTVTVTKQALAPFIHCDFNAAGSLAADTRYGLGNLNPTRVPGRNGTAGVFNSTYKPYWGANTSGASPFYAGQATVAMLFKPKEANNTIVWNLGAESVSGIALIAKDSSTISLVSWKDGAAGAEVVSVSGIANLLNHWHFVAVVGSTSGTTLYVDKLSATTDSVLPYCIGTQVQFGSIHGGKKSYNWVEGDGFLLDDWSIYDGALSPLQIKALKLGLLPDPFGVILR